MGDSASALVIDNLHKSFAEVKVLQGLSLVAERHDVIALIGASGAGKSTLLRCINLLDRPDQGVVQVNGETIFRNESGQAPQVVKPRQVQTIRAGIGMVFQQFNLWSHMKVERNVMEAPMRVLGLSRRQARARAHRLLERVGMYAQRDSYPAHLSGGQQQRVAIARALAMEPKLMLLDEPTSALDPELVAEVLQIVRSLAEEGRTMLMATHEMAFAREVSTKVMFLHEGRIEESGCPTQVFQTPRSQRLQQFLSTQLP